MIGQRLCLSLFQKKSQKNQKRKRKRKRTEFEQAIVSGLSSHPISQPSSRSQQQQKRARVEVAASATSSKQKHQEINDRFSASSEHQEWDGFNYTIYSNYRKHAEYQHQRKLLLLPKFYQLLQRLKHLKCTERKCYGYILESDLFKNQSFMQLVEYCNTNECESGLEFMHFHLENVIKIMSKYKYEEILHCDDCKSCRFAIILFEYIHNEKLLLIVNVTKFNQYELNYKVKKEKKTQHQLK